jgi:hypothetical protein
MARKTATREFELQAVRLHSSLGVLSSEEFERTHNQNRP